MVLKGVKFNLVKCRNPVVTEFGVTQAATKDSSQLHDGSCRIQDIFTCMEEKYLTPEEPEQSTATSLASFTSFWDCSASCVF